MAGFTGLTNRKYNGYYTKRVLATVNIYQHDDPTTRYYISLNSRAGPRRGRFRGLHRPVPPTVWRFGEEKVGPDRRGFMGMDRYDDYCENHAATLPVGTPSRWHRTRRTAGSLLSQSGDVTVTITDVNRTNELALRKVLPQQVPLIDRSGWLAADAAQRCHQCKGSGTKLKVFQCKT